MIRGKRGVSILLKEVVYILLAIMVVILLFSLVARLLTFFSINEKDRAEGMLSNIANNLESIPMNTGDEIYVYSPEDLYLISFSNNQPLKDVKLPNQCLSQNCICICDGSCSKKVYCKIISKPLNQNGLSIKSKIPFSMEVMNTLSEFNASAITEEGKGKVEVVEKKSSLSVSGLKINTDYSLISKLRTNLNSVQYVILHHTGGSTFQSAYATLQERGLSVHYIIDREGIVYYLVDEKRMAYHARGMNDISIGIEIVNTGAKSMQYTDAQYNSIKLLLRSIASRWPNIKYDDTHILAHYQTENGIEIGKWDPSPNFDWAKIDLPSHQIIDLAKVPKEGGYA